MCQLFFDAESIHEISKLYLNKFCNGRTDGWTDGGAQSNMPLQRFQSWEHKNVVGSMEDLKFLTVYDRLYLRKAKFMQKVSLGECPPYISE